MAIGDKAAAKGLAVFPNTQAHGLGFQNDNQRGDELADEITARGAAVTAEALARATADALKLDASKIIYSASQPAYVAGAIWLLPV